MALVMVDLDGVLIDPSKREETANTLVAEMLACAVNRSVDEETLYSVGKQLFYSRAAFYNPDLLVYDTLMPGAYDQMKQLSRRHTCIMHTSRPEFLREATEEWLKVHAPLVYVLPLVMRPIAAPKYTETKILKSLMAALIASAYDIETVFIDNDPTILEQMKRDLPKITTYTSLEEAFRDK